MTILRFDLPLSLTLEAPFSIPGGATSALGVDIALARNADKKVIVPASHLKGVLSAACAEIAAAAPEAKIGGDALGELLAALFGKEDAAETPTGEMRGIAQFGDLVAGDGPEEDPKGRCVRVEIDETMGAAQEGHLVFVEAPWPHGTKVTFTGVLRLLTADKARAEAARVLLTRGLARLVSVGGMKSAGFGRVHACEVEAPEPVVAAEVSAPATRLKLRYRIDRPLLVDAQRVGSNLSIGSEIIPGAAIKGVLAQALKAVGWQDDEALAQARVGHAVPEGAPPPLPLSLYTAGNTLHCALLNGLGDRDGAPVFSPDWKGEVSEKARRALGFAAPPGLKQRGLTRTAIGKAGTVRYDDEEGGALFSQIAVDPGRQCWTGTVTLPNADFAAKLLGLLEAGCAGLGKTKAVLSLAETVKAPVPAISGDGAFALTLVTPAAIFPPDPGPSNAWALYDAYFKTLGCTLVNFFAHQSVRGDYLALRYKPISGKYMPWILTDPGSVFLLKPDDAAGLERLNAVLAEGLPPHPDLPNGWQNNPFLPENGFGEVRLDVIDHGSLVTGSTLT